MYRYYADGGFDLAHRDYGEGVVAFYDAGLYPAETAHRADREPLEITTTAATEHPLDGHPRAETFDVPRTYAPLLVSRLGAGGLRELDGRTGRATLQMLENAVDSLGTAVYTDVYYVPVGRPVEGLDLALARECGIDPDDRENAALAERALAAGAARQAPGLQKPTPGNVGALLAVLRGWAAEHPDGVWNVD